MADYINRDSVIELSREYYSQGLKEEAVPVKAIKNIPSADVAEVRHVDWKWRNGGECSECGFHNSYFGYNFCPNCGCDMRKEIK